MTIHPEHPFLDPSGDRDPVRRLRGRVGATVSLWTTGTGAARAGLTVSSLMVAPGDPGRVVGLVDPDSDLADAVARTGTAVVQLLRWRDRDLADAFAGVAPAPGGPFRAATWTDSAWGPVLDGVGAWAGLRLEPAPRTVGWSLLLEGVVEHVHLDEPGSVAGSGQGDEPLVHRRGRYVRPS